MWYPFCVIKPPPPRPPMPLPPPLQSSKKLPKPTHPSPKPPKKYNEYSKILNHKGFEKKTFISSYNK